MGLRNRILPPNARALNWLTAAAIFFSFIMALQVVSMLVPRRIGAPAKKAEAKVCVGQLAAALKQYYTEYGKWPDFTGEGDFLAMPGTRDCCAS